LWKGHSRIIFASGKAIPEAIFVYEKVISKAFFTYEYFIKSIIIFLLNNRRCGIHIRRYMIQVPT